MKTFILSLALLPLAACTANQAAPEPRLTERETRELERLIDGKVAGEPVSCVTSYDSSKLRSIGDNTLAYVANKNLVYLNRLAGACHGIARGDALVMERHDATQYCRGDIARVLNLPSGILAGSCVLGDFAPYSTADK